MKRWYVIAMVVGCSFSLIAMENTSTMELQTSKRADIEKGNLKRSIDVADLMAQLKVDEHCFDATKDFLNKLPVEDYNALVNSGKDLKTVIPYAMYTQVRNHNTSLKNRVTSLIDTLRFTNRLFIGSLTSLGVVATIWAITSFVTLSRHA